jgi:hypothetical protein
MFDKTINVKTIDLSGVNLPTDDETTCDLIYSALSTTYGFPIYMENFKVNGVKHDSVLVNPIISENQTIINLNDCHLIVTPTEISVGKGVYGVSLESIVDSHSNPRFVEGDITMITFEGITQTYGKWSLSGTHLMIVVCADVANGTTIPNYDMAFISLPAWILNKINPLIASRIETKDVLMYNTSFTTQVITVVLTKGETSLGLVTRGASVQLTADRKFRIQFDLLVDAE